jgi:hypothetical protein
MAIKNLVKNNPWLIGLILWILGLVGVVVEYRGLTPSFLEGVWAVCLVFGWIGITIGVYLDAKIHRIEHAWVPTFYTLITVGIGLFFYLLFARITKETRGKVLGGFVIAVLGALGGVFFVGGILERHAGHIIFGLILLIPLILVVLAKILGIKY